MNWFHRHGPWDVVGASCDSLHYYFHDEPCGYFRATHVAMRCKVCGAIKARTIRGNFAVEQLQGEDDEVSKVLKELER